MAHGEPIGQSSYGRIICVGLTNLQHTASFYTNTHTYPLVIS